ncbi:hypothetical protein DB346_20920 [Verrucomicrobia bacterium LW23]|nr:hypothetical protein DB346_20920 [Verrucomicrobia bacterium LW23]
MSAAMPALDLIYVAVGLFLLLAGRRLYMFLVAVAGFMMGLEAARLMGADALGESVRAMISLGAGVTGILLIRYVQGAAVVLSGTMAGSYVGYGLSSAIGALLKLPAELQMAQPWAAGVVCVVLGGIAGGILLWFFFDWSVIILSSACGGLLVTDVLHLTPDVRLMVALTLTATGVFVQGTRLLGMCSPCLEEAEN